MEQDHKYYTPEEKPTHIFVEHPLVEEVTFCGLYVNRKLGRVTKKYSDDNELCKKCADRLKIHLANKYGIMDWVIEES